LVSWWFSVSLVPSCWLWFPDLPGSPFWSSMTIVLNIINKIFCCSAITAPMLIHVYLDSHTRFQTNMTIGKNNNSYRSTLLHPCLQACLDLSLWCACPGIAYSKNSACTARILEVERLYSNTPTQNGPHKTSHCDLQS
jgi:hypothetical protein